MDIWKKVMMFATGGGSYVTMELLWRGRSHGTMFLAGGTCFLLLGGLRQANPKLSALKRGVAGSGIITAVELLVGLIANRDHSVWDYRHLPMNYRGQVCLPFTLLWIPVSLGAMGLYQLLDKGVERLRK